MAGMFSTVFSSVDENVQGMEDRTDGATDDVTTAGEARAAQADDHMQKANDRGEGAVDRTESRADHASGETGQHIDQDVGAHARFEVSIHAEASGSYQDAGGTDHDYSRSFDAGTGETEIGQDLNLGGSIATAFDTAHTSESAFETMQ